MYCSELTKGNIVAFNRMSNLLCRKIPVDGIVMKIHTDKKYAEIISSYGCEDIEFHDLLAVSKPDGNLDAYKSIIGNAELLQ